MKRATIRLLAEDGWEERLISRYPLMSRVYGRALPDGTFEESSYRVGAEGTLGCSSNDRTGWGRWFLDFEEGGISGNMNRNIGRYHGWRGTTNGTSKCAYGWRRVLRIEERKYGWAVIVGPDLHPEWE